MDLGTVINFIQSAQCSSHLCLFATLGEADGHAVISSKSLLTASPVLARGKLRKLDCHSQIFWLILCLEWSF